MRSLNRCIEWRHDGIYYEADPRHAEIIVQQMCSEGSAATVTTAGITEKTTEEDTEKYLSPEKGYCLPQDCCTSQFSGTRYAGHAICDKSPIARHVKTDRAALARSREVGNESF